MSRLNLQKAFKGNAQENMRGGCCPAPFQARYSALTNQSSDRGGENKADRSDTHLRMRNFSLPHSLGRAAMTPALTSLEVNSNFVDFNIISVFPTSLW